MSATEVLRRLLDERGVEWESGLPTETIVREPNDALYVERQDGRMHVYFRSYLTPEQAIAATLGSCSDSCNCTNGERTDLDAATLARSLRRMAGDGSVEWVCEPMQASVLLDIADMLDESARLFALLKHESEQTEKLRELCEYLWEFAKTCGADHPFLRELGIEVDG